MPPRVSVVIPTHARETRLAFALDSLAEQTAPLDSFEVVVVRSPGASPPFANAPDGIDVTWLISEKHGAPAKRNVGWLAARAPLVAFMDDDCRVAPGWVDQLLAAARTRGADHAFLVQGRTAPDPDELHLLSGLARTVEISAPSGLYETCNLAIPVGLLRDLGGFDESFKDTWGEDTDLGLRAEEMGAELVWNGDALAWHAVHAQPLWRALRDARRRREHARLIARHPRLRRQMPGGIFVNVAHGDVTFALGCMLAIPFLSRGKLALAGIAPAPYLSRVTTEFVRAEPGISRRRVARFIAHLPSRALIDAVETLWTIRGALDQRTPVA